MTQYPGSSGGHPLAEWPRPLAFVLSGGGSYGAAQVGMLQALEAAGVRPDRIVGTSVGALNGVLVASEPAGSGELLNEAWGQLSAGSLFGRGGRVRSAIGFLRWRKSLCDPSALHQAIDDWLVVERFDDLRVPLSVVVTDIDLGDAVLLTEGPLAPALVATSAIPGVFPPVEIDGRSFIDGGVTANVPVRQAIAAGARSVVVLNAAPATLAGKRPTSIVGSLMHASALMLRSQRAHDVDDLGRRFPILHLPQVTPASLNSFDFSHTDTLIESAQRRSTEFLASLATSPVSSPPS